jgi:hypothetical protein
MKRLLFAALGLLLPSVAAAGVPVSITGYTTVRSAAILTSSYVGTTAILMGGSNSLLCHVSMTLGSLTTIEVKAQYSDVAATTWYDEQERQSPTVTAATGIDQSIGLVYPKIYQYNDSAYAVLKFDNLGHKMRLAIKGTGTATSSSATISCYNGAL